MSKSLRQLEQVYIEAHRNKVNIICHVIGIPTILLAIVILPFYPFLSITMFALGWLFQFVGHFFEGQRPRFFEDPRYLLVGPIFFARKFWAFVVCSPKKTTQN